MPHFILKHNFECLFKNISITIDTKKKYQKISQNILKITTKKKMVVTFHISNHDKKKCKQTTKKAFLLHIPNMFILKFKKKPLTRILSYYTAMQTLLPHLFFLKKKFLIT